ncbi:hypothetical protein [Saccharopolyspora sp. NPDC002686]
MMFAGYLGNLHEKGGTAAGPVGGATGACGRRSDQPCADLIGVDDGEELR